MIDNPSWKTVRDELESGGNTEAIRAFAEIEKEVERLVRDYNGQLQADRELRNALEADTAPGAEIQRRGGGY